MSVDNPPAFPRAATEYDTWGHSGMTLRDYFAGQVAPAVLTRLWQNMERDRLWVDSYEVAAKASYEMADAMLAARSAGEGE